MIRRTALFSALSLALLLGACSKKDDTEGDQAQAEQQAAAEGQAEGDASADAAPAPKMNYWPVVGPFVAGNYSGACTRMPDARKMDAAITVGADGKASAAGMAVDFTMAKKTMLMRTRDDKGQYNTMAMFSVDDDKAGMLTLQTGKAGEGSYASLSRDDVGLVCSNAAGIEKLNAQPLYLSLGKLLNGKKQAVSCLDTSNLLVRRDLAVELSDGVLKVGDARFDMREAVNESFVFDDAGSTAGLILVLPEERRISVMYDGAGQVTNVTAFDKEGSTHACDRKEG
ncbi:hypothetical protein [Massilia sp. Leaf139]|uniref:hypothetical protein n=1 Tax=Massilia sp. Leaf139 TaxID=1736272 RepID=UPI0006FC59DE|nr:hypothetical protein [Massilia sp. Leaf139]KQQ87861.1 hypothetical protein ASF77_14095 [Massilia sp. Leaf139]